jgi:hypothetical protein
MPEISQNSQNPQTAKLGRKIRHAREKLKMRWKDICELYGIFTEDGKINPGMAYKIAYYKHEPGTKVSHRIGLPEVCHECKRKIRHRHKQAAPRAKSPARAWWDHLKPGERQKVIELSHRNYLDWNKSHKND